MALNFKLESSRVLNKGTRITCRVLVDPVTTLLLPTGWNDITVSCLSGIFRHSSTRNKDA